MEKVAGFLFTQTSSNVSLIPEALLQYQKKPIAQKQKWENPNMH
jgi:hypothetical protein